MGERAKNAAVVLVFCAFLFLILLAHIFLPDRALSVSERRKLQQLPRLNSAELLSGGYMRSLESYVSDQFPMRDGFRTIKAAMCFYVFGQKDNNGICIVDDTVLKLEDRLDEKQLNLAAQKINNLAEQYLSSCRVYYSVIPDKNYFVAEQNGYPHMDYDRLFNQLGETISAATYIDITESLDISDYYRTDSHWRQERLEDTVDVLLSGMDVQREETAYERQSLYPFHGVYYGQAALPMEPDELVWLTSDITENAVVSGIDASCGEDVYEIGRFSGMDGYDMFLSGAQSIITVQRQNVDGKELILFRDSFGSSIAPLLLEGYSKITLIDLRYISSNVLDSFVDFNNQDVLFLYSTTLLNSAGILR